MLNTLKKNSNVNKKNIKSVAETEKEGHQLIRIRKLYVKSGSYVYGTDMPATDYQMNRVWTS